MATLTQNKQLGPALMKVYHFFDMPLNTFQIKGCLDLFYSVQELKQFYSEQAFRQLQSEIMTYIPYIDDVIENYPVNNQNNRLIIN